MKSFPVSVSYCFVDNVLNQGFWNVELDTRRAICLGKERKPVISFWAARLTRIEITFIVMSSALMTKYD